MSLRVAFKCNDPDDSTSILGESNYKAAYLERSGLACVTYDPTLMDKTVQVKVSYVSEDDRKTYLEDLHKTNQKLKFGQRWKANVFKKTEPALWQDCLQVEKLLDNRDAEYPDPIIWLGKPVRLAEDQTIVLSNQEGENVLLMGADDKMAFQSLIHCLLSLALTCHPTQADFFWLTAPRNSFPNASEYLQKIKALPHFKIHNPPSRYALEKIMEYKETQIGKTFVFVQGLHSISEFRNSENPDAPPLGEILEKILCEGSQNGIHTILWVDRYETLRNMISFNVLDHFKHRIAFHINKNDSNELIGTYDASKLGTDNRLLYRCQSWQEGVVDKIKPYSLPDLSEFLKVAQRIHRRWE